MNVNEKILGLENETGLHVEQDLYKGKDTEYVVFTYEDERPVLRGDNRVLADEVILQIKLYTPINFNYFELKDKIRDYLESNGFSVTNIRSWLDGIRSELKNSKEVRTTLFMVNYTEER